MITYEIVASAAGGLGGAVIIVSMLVSWGILISYQEFPPTPMTEMGLHVTELCCRWVRDVSEINQSLQPTRPVIEPTSTPRPLKRLDLTFEAYEIIKYRSGICYFAIHVWLRDHVLPERTWLQHWIEPVLQSPPLRGIAVARAMTGRVRVKTVGKCIVRKLGKDCRFGVVLSLRRMLDFILWNLIVDPEIEGSYLCPLNSVSYREWNCLSFWY